MSYYGSDISFLIYHTVLFGQYAGAQLSMMFYASIGFLLVGFLVIKNNPFRALWLLTWLLGFHAVVVVAASDGYVSSLEYEAAYIYLAFFLAIPVGYSFWPKSFYVDSRGVYAADTNVGQPRNFEPESRWLVHIENVLYALLIILIFLYFFAVQSLGLSHIFLLSGLAFDRMAAYAYPIWVISLQHLIYNIGLPIVLLVSFIERRRTLFSLVCLGAIVTGCLVVGISTGERQGLLYWFAMLSIFLFCKLHRRKFFISILVGFILVFVGFFIATEVQSGRELILTTSTLNIGDVVYKLIYRVMFDPGYMGIEAIKSAYYTTPLLGEVHGVTGLDSTNLYSELGFQLSSYGLVSGAWINFRLPGVLIIGFMYGLLFRGIERWMWSNSMNTKSARFSVFATVFLFGYSSYTELVPVVALLVIASLLIGSYVLNQVRMANFVTK